MKALLITLILTFSALIYGQPVEVQKQNIIAFIKKNIQDFHIFGKCVNIAKTHADLIICKKQAYQIAKQRDIQRQELFKTPPGRFENFNDQIPLNSFEIEKENLLALITMRTMRLENGIKCYTPARTLDDIEKCRQGALRLRQQDLKQLEELEKLNKEKAEAAAAAAAASEKSAPAKSDIQTTPPAPTIEKNTPTALPQQKK